MCKVGSKWTNAIKLARIEMNILVTKSKDGQQFDFSKVQANLGQIPNLNEYLIHYEDDTKIIQQGNVLFA